MNRDVKCVSIHLLTRFTWAIDLNFAVLYEQGLVLPVGSPCDCVGFFFNVIQRHMHAGLIDHS